MISLFKDITPNNKGKLLKLLETSNFTYQKGVNIAYLFKDKESIGLVLSGSLDIIRIDYNGTRTIIETIYEEEILGTSLTSLLSNDYEIITREDTKILWLDYNVILGINDIKYTYYNQFIKNLLMIALEKNTLKNERILDRIQELKQNGFNVTVRALAVPRLESLLTVHERYEKQMEVLTYGRLISIEHHNKAYDGIPAVVDKIEKSGLCTVEVYLRGDEIGKPIRVYSSKEKNERFPTARIALEEYRKLEEQETRKTAKTRVNKLRESFIKRNAKESELKQLDELENWINKPIEK